MAQISKRIVLKFPKELADKPIVYHLIKDFDLVFNILKASITPNEEGLLVLEISGDEESFKKGIDYLEKQGVKIQPLSKDIKWTKEKCTQCGACVTICPTGALYVKDRKTMEIAFDPDKCTACELCILPCPARCIEVHF